MVWRDMVVIGGSAGSIPVLQDIVSQLPTNFFAPVFVVVHIPPWQKSELPEILSRSGPLPALHPADGQIIEPGHIYVAPPDRHLTVHPGRLELARGPKENRHRPSISWLFRSASQAYGERVIGVLLSGMLDDGASGLWWIKERGGIAAVQDPDDASFPAMPHSAMESVPVDYIVPGRDIGELLRGLTMGLAVCPGVEPIAAEVLKKCRQRKV